MKQQMDLLKRVAQARQDKHLAPPSVGPALPKPDDEGITRAYIIEKRPKIKVLREYYEAIVEEAIAAED